MTPRKEAITRPFEALRLHRLRIVVFLRLYKSRLLLVILRRNSDFSHASWIRKHSFRPSFVIIRVRAESRVVGRGSDSDRRDQFSAKQVRVVALGINKTR